CWTPFRDTQVFGDKKFTHAFGPGHSIINHITIITGLLTAISSIPKIFVRDQINILEDIVNNLNRELNPGVDLTNQEIVDQLKKEGKFIDLNEPTVQDDLKKLFEKYLKDTGHHDLKVLLVRKNKRKAHNFFQKKEYWNIQFEYQDPIVHILKNEWPKYQGLTY